MNGKTNRMPGPEEHGAKQEDADAVAREIGRTILSLPQSAQDKLSGAIMMAQLVAAEKAG